MRRTSYSPRFDTRRVPTCGKRTTSRCPRPVFAIGLTAGIAGCESGAAGTLGCEPGAGKAPLDAAVGCGVFGDELGAPTTGVPIGGVLREAVMGEGDCGGGRAVDTEGTTIPPWELAIETKSRILERGGPVN